LYCGDHVLLFERGENGEDLRTRRTLFERERSRAGAYRSNASDRRKEKEEAKGQRERRGERRARRMSMGKKLLKEGALRLLPDASPIPE